MGALVPHVGYHPCKELNTWSLGYFAGIKIDPQAFFMFSSYVCHVLSNIFQPNQNTSFGPILHEFAPTPLMMYTWTSPGPENIPKLVYAIFFKTRMAFNFKFKWPPGLSVQNGQVRYDMLFPVCLQFESNHAIKWAKEN